MAEIHPFNGHLQLSSCNRGSIVRSQTTMTDPLKEHNAIGHERHDIFDEEDFFKRDRLVLRRPIKRPKFEDDTINDSATPSRDLDMSTVSNFPSTLGFSQNGNVDMPSLPDISGPAEHVHVHTLFQTSSNDCLQPLNRCFTSDRGGNAEAHQQEQRFLPLTELNIVEVITELEELRQKNAQLEKEKAELLGILSTLKPKMSDGEPLLKDVVEQPDLNNKDQRLDANCKVKQEELQTDEAEPRYPDQKPSVVTWMSQEIQTMEFERAKREISDRDQSSDNDDSGEGEYDRANKPDDEGDGENFDNEKLHNHEAKYRKHGLEPNVLLTGCSGDANSDLNKTGENQRTDAVSKICQNTMFENGLTEAIHEAKASTHDTSVNGSNSLLKHNFGSDNVPYRGLGVFASHNKKAPKAAFCPKEVKRIMESGLLTLKNAQSHTMRKIIVFASLGIRHGCEDLYELDYNNFSIVKRGESYVSPQQPGEHVLYEHPGVRRKIFYPNRQNPVLCPVHILDEEETMRPSGPSCPSCLFLCIKYGGRTRNLPQNEYVRQRMGRNKLKSFGPLMCQMALLMNIRTGSFFFKALGITLLFMAGFPDDLVRKETKYRNLDLLQKYYRSDEDAKDEQLFHPYTPLLPQALMSVSVPGSLKQLPSTGKVTGKKQPFILSKPPSSQTRFLPPMSAKLKQIGIPHVSTMASMPFPPPAYGLYSSHPPNQGPGAFSPMPWTANPFVPFAYPFPYFSPYGPPYAGNPFYPPTHMPSNLTNGNTIQDSDDSDTSSGTDQSGSNADECSSEG